MNDQAARDSASAIVALPAEIDVTNAGHVYDRLFAAVVSGTPVVIADLTATDFCDAGGVRALIMIREEAAARGSQLRLVIAPGALMRRVLVLLGVDHLLPVYATVAEAGGLLTARQDPLCSWLPQPAWWQEETR